MPFPTHAVSYAGGPADKALRSGYKDVVGINFCLSGFASPLRAGCAVVAGFGSNAVSTACTFVCFPFLGFVSFSFFRALSNSNATRCCFSFSLYLLRRLSEISYFAIFVFPPCVLVLLFPSTIGIRCRWDIVLLGLGTNPIRSTRSLFLSIFSFDNRIRWRLT